MIAPRTGGRVVEGSGLENRQARKRLVGSNPTPSANRRRRGKKAVMTVIRPANMVAEEQGAGGPCGPSRTLWISEAGGLSQFGAFVVVAQGPGRSCYQPTLPVTVTLPPAANWRPRLKCWSDQSAT